MSRSAAIEITYVANRTSTLKLIRGLLKSGWTLDHLGLVTFLPLNDNDEFNWSSLDSTERDRVLDIVRQKEKSKELIGLVMLWNGSNIGMDVLFHQDPRISFILTINRKSLPNCQDFTNINWYIEKIMPALNSCKVTVETIVWQEHV